MLNKYNYAEWAVLMEVMLQACTYWEAVTSINNSNEMMAKETIVRVVPPEMWCPLAKKTTKQT